MAMRWSVRVSPEIYSDPRFHELMKLSEDTHHALGKLVSFWGLAISHYVVGEQVPEEKFRMLRCPELVDCGLAIEVEGGFRAAGESEHFSWAKNAVDSGRKGGYAKAKNRLATIQQPLAALQGCLANSGLEQEQEQEQEQELNTNLNPSHVGNCISSGDGISEKKQKTKKPKTTRPMSEIRALMDCWNENCGSLASVNSKTVSPAREGHINARLEQATVERWAEVFRAIAAWPWGQGDNDRGWKATFDYAIQAGTLDKFESGSFNSRPQPRKNYGRVDARTVSQCLPESEPVFNVIGD